MTRSITRLLWCAFALGCALALGQARAEEPLIVGAAVSETGAHADLAADYRKALLLWQDEVNASGGLLGRRVELRLLDDRSDAVHVGELYRRLIGAEKVDALIGPYGSAATLMAAAEAETARRVLINGSGASRAIHKRSPRYVFQTTIPYSAYGDGALDIAKNESYRKLTLVASDDPVAREMADAAREAALKLGLEAGEVQVYRPGTIDFAPQVAKARSAQVDGWIAFGEVRDTAEMMKSFKKLGYAPRFFFARAAADPKFIALIGQDAEFVLGALAYDARFTTPANGRFVKAFAARWGSPPGLAAAQGYAAASVLGEALRRAGSAEQEKLRAALDSLSTDTVLGQYKVNPKTGEQIGAKPAVVQILKGRAEIIWPRALETAKRVLPYAQWSERRLLK